jgi:hypothetical protein
MVKSEKKVQSLVFLLVNLILEFVRGWCSVFHIFRIKNVFCIIRCVWFRIVVIIVVKFLVKKEFKNFCVFI